MRCNEYISKEEGQISKRVHPEFVSPIQVLRVGHINSLPFLHSYTIVTMICTSIFEVYFQY